MPLNWTEGTLVRHSRPSKGREVLLRQKEYFAKVRAGLLNANVKTRPPSISFSAYPAHPSRNHLHSPPSLTSASCSLKKRMRNSGMERVSPESQNDDVLKLSSVVDFQEPQIEEEALRQKRRRLLLRGDWTGINLQKPIEMDFPRSRASFSGPWGHSKSRQARSKSKMHRVLGTKHARGEARDPRMVVKATRPNSPIQLRVRVGSRERVFGGSSNVSPQSKTCKNVGSSPIVFWNPEPTYDKQSAPIHRGNTSTSDPEHQSPKLPELHQPLPRWHLSPSLLRSSLSNLDDAASTKAQVGLLKPDVPSSQLEENEAWWSFAGAADQVQCPRDLQPSDCEVTVLQRQISPGISQFGRSDVTHDPNGELELIEVLETVNTETEGYSGSCIPRQQGFPPCQDLEFFADEGLKEADLSSTVDKATDSNAGSSPCLHKQNPETNQDVAPIEQPGLSNADDESLLVMPTSCSPTSEELFPQSHNYRISQDQLHNIIAPSLLLGRHLCENKKDLKLRYEQQDTVTDQELPKPPNSKQDLSDMWKEFVLGDSPNNLQEAFEEARKETARNLCPSDLSSSTSGHDPTSCESGRLYTKASETTALNSCFNADLPDFSLQHDSASARISAVASVSQMATDGYSSSDPLSGPDPADLHTGATVENASPDPLSEFAPDLAYSDTTIRNDAASIEPSSSFKDTSLGFVDGFSGRSDTWNVVTGRQDDASLAAHPPSTPKYNEANDSFKFARPKAFLGKKKSHLDEERQIALSAPQVRGRGMTRRRQRRTVDGRASIRNVPNFDSDPIEEVEDAVSVRGEQKPSLFGSLDTEET